MTTHTPAPWSFDSTRDYSPKRVIRHNGLVVCVLLDSKADDEAEADARLIAAAPDLLAACKAASHFLSVAGSVCPSPQEREVLDMLDEAIAKAETP